MINPSQRNRNNRVIVSAFILGFTSITGQVLLLRELITVFYGNEMAYAVILASWLFWVAVGSYAASFLSHRIKNPADAVGLLQGAIYFILPATVIASRHIKQFMHVETGEIIGIIPMGVSSFVLLAPLTLFFGALFAAICFFSDRDEGEARKTYAIGNVYFWESAGAAVGGLIFSFLLVRTLPAMHIAFLMGAVNLAVGVVFHKRKSFFYISKMILILATVIMLFSGLIDKIDRWTRARQWEGLEVVAVTDSVYGNITMTRTGEEYGLYQNGLFSFATRDELSSEESVHFPLLEHPRPRRALLIGNGMGGGLEEILKHPGVRVDYVELDPKVVDVSEKYLPARYSEPLRDERVDMIHTDARWFVKQTSEKYDVVIVNLADPYTALINRYYSLEFFREARKILNPKGILALSVSSSENYLNEEARTFLRSVNTTLKNVFADVRSIPGDTNVFLACVSKGVLTYDHQVLIGRLQARGVETKYIREYYLPSKLSPDRIRYIEDVLSEEGTLNTDTRPVAYLYDIVLWSTHFNTTFKNIVAKAQHLKFHYLLLLPGLIFLVGWGFRKVSPTVPVTLSIVTTGFSEIIFQLIVILAFQTLYGYAYYKIGLIIASFMAGLCFGTMVARRIIRDRPAGVARAYKQAQCAIVLYPAILPLVFIIFRDISTTPQLLGAFATAFASLPAIAGFIGGLQYPLATHLVHAHRPKEEKGKGAAKAAGVLYALDVFGAALGALVTGALLIPLYGIFAVALLCVAINAAVLALLYPAKLSPEV